MLSRSCFVHRQTILLLLVILTKQIQINLVIFMGNDVPVTSRLMLSVYFYLQHTPVMSKFPQCRLASNYHVNVIWTIYKHTLTIIRHIDVNNLPPSTNRLIRLSIQSSKSCRVVCSLCGVNSVCFVIPDDNVLSIISKYALLGLCILE